MCYRWVLRVCPVGSMMVSYAVDRCVVYGRVMYALCVCVMGGVRVICVWCVCVRVYHLSGIGVVCIYLCVFCV